MPRCTAFQLSHLLTSNISTVAATLTTTRFRRRALRCLSVFALLSLSVSLTLAAADSAVSAGTTPLRLTTSIDALPIETLQRPSTDWLLRRAPYPAGVFRSKSGKELVLNNGLIRRAWRLSPNAATVAFDNLMSDEPILRAVKPEAILTINSNVITVGGLAGQRDTGFLRQEWLDALTVRSNSLRFTGYETGPIQPRLEWKRRRYSATDLPWPPAGVELILHFEAPISPTQPAASDPSPSFSALTAGLQVSVHYELYDGIPLLSKRIVVRNQGSQTVTLDTFTSELLAAVEFESVVDKRDRWEYPNLHVQSDYSFRGMDTQTANQTTRWVIDPEYTTQVNASSTTPCLLESRPPIGPSAQIPPGGRFESFRTFELAHDSTDRERKGLAVRQMYRRVAPWIAENPIMMHVRNAEPKAVRLAIDQCAEVGFEMVIISFWSGFDMENEKPEYIAQYQELTDYAHSRGIELGAYSLLASRSVGPTNDIVDPATGKAGGTFGVSPCIESHWGHDYFRKLYAFYEKTGMDLLEHDGSYPGDVCGSTSHPGHRGLSDSQWTQWSRITEFYRWCRARGIYLNVPDLYFLNGSSKCGMGYRESNWSLPRAQQVIHARQNIYDGTWEKTPSMGWMLVPLVEYGGGGPAATIEPLSQHLDHYELTLANNFGAGVQACYRGPRLYDTDETKAVVKRWTDFYRKHRAILDSDLVHGRRPDARDLDFYLHVNPSLEEKALIMVFNPLDNSARKDLVVPLYYAGVGERVRVANAEGKERTYRLDRNHRIILPVEMKPQSAAWFVVKNAASKRN